MYNLVYPSRKKRGVFQHCSVSAGGTTIAAGRFTAENGAVKVFCSNHTLLNVRIRSKYFTFYVQRTKCREPSNFMTLLEENGVDLKEVEVTILTIHKLKYSCLTKLQMNSFNVLALGLAASLSQNLSPYC